jgi:hypothetical protein
MELLGKYNSTISSYLYNSLLQLFTSNVTKDGDNGGVLNISDSNILALVNQADTTSSIPLPSFNSRSNEEQINYPIDLLEAKYTAIQSELNSFTTNSEILIARLQNEAALLDKLIYQAKLSYWISTLYPVLNAEVYSWDYNQGLGLLSLDVGLEDPVGLGTYAQNTNIQKVLDVTNGYREGLVANETEITVPCTNLIWTPETTGQVATIDGKNIGQINVLETVPQVVYNTSPNHQVTLPEGGSIDGIFSISGNTSLGPITTYIRTGFYPRESEQQVIASNAIANTAFTTGWTNSGWTISAGRATSGAGSITSPFLVDSAGVTFVGQAGQTVYVQVTLDGNTGAAQIHPKLLLYDDTGALTSTIALSIPSPTGVGNPYNWFFIMQLPTSASGMNLKLQFVTTDNNWTLTAPLAYVPINLSGYQVYPNTVSVFTRESTGRIGVVFSRYTGYIVNGSEVTFVGLTNGQALTVRYTELYPYYQCSVNNANWSPIVMLDPLRPYEDKVPITHLVKITGPFSALNTLLAGGLTPLQAITSVGLSNFLFPITDERGYPTGLSIAMVGIPSYAYLFQVSVTANQTWGETATLEVDLATTGYINGITINPFVKFPMNLVQVRLEGFSPAVTNTVWSSPSSFELDAQLTIAFPTQLVKKAYLTFTQQGYTPVDNQIGGVAFIRNQTLQQIQNVLPVNAQRTFPVTYDNQSGFEYSIGIEDVAGVNNTAEPTSVTVSGPFLFNGCPEIISYNSVTSGTLGQYLCYIAYNIDGTEVESNTLGFAITDGVTQVMPFTTDRSLITSVNFYFKYVLSSADASVTRFCLQVTKR